MEETEKFFRCPFCHGKISVLLDTSASGQQSYIEDCEVCCRPLEISYEAADGELVSFFVQAMEQ